jgi:outer membrane protein TolC
VPVVPAGIPSTLLERRPDIAAAERSVASANALIGVAEAAWFPSVTLSGSYGFSSGVLPGLLRAKNSLWSFGPSLAENVFNGGATLAPIARRAPITMRRWRPIARPCCRRSSRSRTTW